MIKFKLFRPTAFDDRGCKASFFQLWLDENRNIEIISAFQTNDNFDQVCILYKEFEETSVTTQGQERIIDIKQNNYGIQSTQRKP